MNIISNPVEIKELQGVLQEISDALTRMDGEKSLIKEIKITALENHKDKITAKQLNKLSKTFHKNNYSQEVQDNEEFQLLFETITGTKLDE